MEPLPTRPESPASLEGRVIAIAGAGGNLGPTLVRKLEPTGARLALGGRDVAPLELLAAEVGAESHVGEVDLLDPESTRGWATTVHERFRRIDCLVHLVGGWRGGTAIEEASLEDWDWLHDRLMRTLQHATRAFLPYLLDSGRGRFVVVSTGQAQAPTHRNAAYASAKAAAEAWTLALADRFKGTGSTSNIVVVGAIVTPEMRRESPDEDFSTFTPAEEIAEAVAYLCSDAAASMNGQRLTLRGAA